MEHNAHQQIEAEVASVARNFRINAWLLWFFFGGVGAHFAYLYPKARTWIVVGGIVGLFVTFGLSGVCLWLFTWPWLLSKGSYAGLYEQAITRAEERQVRRATLG